ncbi:MAG TPA: hypothetical protein VMD02_01570 [Candidatus Omnitrophota bacterium]|nr:hypothetical protein [Candidatus Omnitrophota bacterium]
MRCLFLLLLLAFALSSCSYSEQTPTTTSNETPTVEVETPSRGPVLVYGRPANGKEITLRFGAEPVMLSCGYVRLTGTVLGDDPGAVIEIGGKGLVFGIGEEIGGYRIASIDDKEVKLCLKR